MTEVLKEWLTERLQRPIIWEATQFGDLMKNGKILADLLLSYNVIDKEKHYIISPSNAVQDISNNWKYLFQWLQEIDVHVDESTLKNIMEGKGSTILRLFYQLFLTLDKRDRTDFIKCERKMASSLVTKMANRFKVKKIDETVEPTPDDLSRPLLNERHYIEWQKRKSDDIKEAYGIFKHKYSKIIENIENTTTPIKYSARKCKPMLEKQKKEIEEFAKRYPYKIKNYSYDELIQMEQDSLKRKVSLIDTEWAIKYMDNLYTRIHNDADSVEFQKQLTNDISKSIWEETIVEEEDKYDNELIKKVMKLSQFEKQMCTQIMETKQQARNLAKNRIQAEKQYTQQRESQFSQYLDSIKEQLHLDVMEIDFDIQRQQRLHKRLYAEKLMRKRKLYYQICYETILSIMDYAVKYADYKQMLGSEHIPYHYIHEWKLLYYKQQPIFDILQYTEDLLNERQEEEEMLPEVEEIIRLELKRQESLNDSEFLEYHNYLGPWTLDLLILDYNPDSEESKYEIFGNHILGQVVYTLLDIKYPRPPQLPPADLPDFQHKAILRNLQDKAVTVPMQILLNFNKVLVVRVETALNYCLNQYKNELLGSQNIEITYDSFYFNAKTIEDKELVRAMTNEESNTSIDAGIIIPTNCKITQTPKALPEEDIVLSRAAELGKYAYDVLSFGDSLTDYLLAAVIVEYIRVTKDINGFVIVNYPNTYRAAKILEVTLSGKEPPLEEELQDRDDIFLEEAIINHRKKETDPFKAIRVSKLVNDPRTLKYLQPFDSYFTCYINLKETKDILRELVIWELTEDNSELIDRFYALLGINYSMYYELMDKEFLGQICKYIIGDFSLPLKSCDSLFGSQVFSNLDFPCFDESKRRKSIVLRPGTSSLISNDRLQKNSRRSLNIPTPSLEIVSSTAIVISDSPITNLEDKIIEPVIILPGDKYWVYGEMPLPEIIAVALATCWEEIEKTYIKDMEQLFFSKRLQMNCLVPYARFIKDKMEQILSLPSQNQDLVIAFQESYNNYEDDWRDIHLTKDEWHCRIKELQQKLNDICDQKKQNAEQRRLQLIKENWALEELLTMANTYISCMQCELNRCMLTFQILHDFYYSMLKGMPPSDRILPKSLNKINRESEDSTKKVEDKVYRQLKQTYQNLILRELPFDYNDNPFDVIIDTNVKASEKIIKDVNYIYRTKISSEYNEIARAGIAPKKKDARPEEIDEGNTQDKENSFKCVEEWAMGVNGEMFRACLRMQALQSKCSHDMKLFNDCIHEAFTDVAQHINTYYHNEIQSIDRLCKYLQIAVEQGRKIPETLVLKQDEFIIDPNMLQFTPAPPIEPVIKELDQETEFKISQLIRLRLMFKIVAPTGIALHKAFIYMLQDFLCFGKDSCEGNILPSIWKYVDPNKISKLIQLLYGDTTYVDWRDFLITCLNIRFPTVEDLLALRKKYCSIDTKCTELLNREDFFEEELWFEKDFDQFDHYAQLRKNLIKPFLFDLFESSENMINYSAFLLAFCKSFNPIEGFATALSMVVGNKVCFSIEECGDIVCHLVSLKQARDAQHELALEIVKKMIDETLESVLTICDGVIITDSTSSTEVIGKKSKKDKIHKTQKDNDTTSVKFGEQLTAVPELSKQKIANVAVSINMTYICPPCSSQTALIEEIIPKIVEEEEEHSIVAEADPNLIYTVSQDVIWKVLKACLPWHFVLVPEQKPTPYVDTVTKVMENIANYTYNKEIYVSMFLSEPEICKLLNRVKRFTLLDIIPLLKRVCDSKTKD